MSSDKTKEEIAINKISFILSKNLGQTKDKYEFPSDVKEELFFVRPDDRITSDIMSHYEYCRILQIRAKQIEKDNVVFTNVSGLTDPIKMAEKEIKDRKCPLSVVRKLNDKLAEKWDVNELILNF